MEDDGSQKPKSDSVRPVSNSEQKTREGYALEYRSRKDQTERSVWAAAAMGFGVAVGVGMSSVSLLATPAFDLDPFQTFAVIAISFVVLVGVLFLWTRWLNRRGFAAGCALGIGFCLLCPVVAVLVICGGMRF